MKTFEDLEFKTHECLGGCLHATMTFPNGNHISVVTGGTFFYIDATHPYEAQITTGKDETDDGIRGHLTSQDVTELMIGLQQ